MKKIISVILSFVILIVILNVNIVRANTAVLLGDLNNNGQIDAMDLVYMRKYLMGIDRDKVSFSSADLVLDNQINVLDYIKLVKTFVGYNRNTYGNQQNNGVSWIIFNKTNGIITTIPLGYRIISSCHVTTNEDDERTVYEGCAFVHAEKNPNPKIAYPETTVGTTKINNKSINMNYSSNVLVSPSWLWDFKAGYPDDLVVSKNSEFSCLISCMHKDALVPLNTVTNTFTF